MRPLFASVVMMAMLAGPAYSQKGQSQDIHPANRDPFQLKLEREKKEQEENEKAYNAQMKRLKGQEATPTNSDPWKNVRPASDPAPKR